MGKTVLGGLLNRATTAPVPFVARAASHAFGFASRRDAVAHMAAMGSVGTLFSIVNRTSNATSQVEWKLWRKSKSGKKEDRVEVTAHAALDLWDKPNRFMPRQEFVETFQQHVDLVGEGWWVIARDPRSPIPLEIWPVRPDRITPVPDPERFLTGYMYTSPDGEQIALELDQVIQLRMPNPLDPYRGMGPVQSILSDLDATKYSAEWNRNFFLNSAEPGGVLEVDRRLDDDEFAVLRMRWNEQHKGVANAHRVAIAEGGLKWVDRKMTQRDMQFVELRSVSRDVIREAFGIPAFALGEVADVNRATAEASKTWFAEMLTVPRLERIKGALNHELLPLFGSTAQGLEFDYCDPVPPDVATEAAQLTARATAARDLVDAGFYPPEVREALGLPEMSYGQPDADQDRELLIDLVKAAPAALAQTILPLLGFDLPPSPAPAEPAKPAPPQPANRLPLGPGLAALVDDEDDIENAMRWVAVEHDDDDTCEPCRENDGKLYRNRAEAYKDYPGGSGYIHCVGAEHGNECRGKVVKRRVSREETDGAS
ncbi:phage portal protein [Streptomyces sp. NPDC096153]|uniref:phage portal protein n=1 Tax=Streptomyces sp. NPDC096153 TaxID=3155548 RepID=UPI0033322044